MQNITAVREVLYPHLLQFGNRPSLFTKLLLTIRLTDNMMCNLAVEIDIWHLQLELAGASGMSYADLLPLLCRGFDGSVVRASV